MYGVREGEGERRDDLEPYASSRGVCSELGSLFRKIFLGHGAPIAGNHIVWPVREVEKLGQELYNAEYRHLGGPQFRIE